MFLLNDEIMVYAGVFFIFFFLLKKFLEILCSCRMWIDGFLENIGHPTRSGTIESFVGGVDNEIHRCPMDSILTMKICQMCHNARAISKVVIEPAS